MKREIEALLFATDSPLTLNRLKKLFPGVENKEIRESIQELQQEYEQNGNAFDIVEFGGGFQIATRQEFSPIVEKMLKSRRFTRLSKAGLEVLAIVAYRQPITRLEIDEIRGVNSSGAISTLSERNLITVVGRSQTVGNPLLYGTTREFLNHLGLKGLGQLPDLPDLETVMENKDELKEFANKVGRDVSEEELIDYFSDNVDLVPDEEPIKEESTEDTAEENNDEQPEADTPVAEDVEREIGPEIGPDIDPEIDPDLDQEAGQEKENE